MGSVTIENQYAAALIVVFCSSTYLSLSIVSVFLLLHRRSNKAHSLKRGQKVILAYTIVMGSITLVWTGVTVYNIGLSLVEHRMPPPGRDNQAFWQKDNHWQNALGTLIFVGSDALMVYRVYAMYRGNLIVTSLSVVIYLSFIAVAILINLVPLSTQFGGPLALWNVHEISTAFFTLTVCLNTLVCALIAAKLLYFRRLTTMYGSIVVIIVESAAIYAICSVVFVIIDHVRPSAGFWFGAVANCSAFLNQGWIILRVVIGQSTTPGGTTISTQGMTELRRQQSSSTLQSHIA